MRDAILYLADLAGDPSVAVALSMLPLFCGLAGLYWTWAWLWAAPDQDD